MSCRREAARGERRATDTDAFTRRTAVKRAATLGLAASTLGALDLFAFAPARAAAAKGALPEIQYQIEKYLESPVSVEGVRVRFAPVYTVFLTATLARTPTSTDQEALAAALTKVESVYPFTPSGVFLTVAYGIPYFERLPGGMTGSLVSANMPRLSSDPSRYPLEEAVPAPTDVSPLNPGVKKRTFNVPVAIESNEVVLALRSDSSANIDEIVSWLFEGATTLAGKATPASGLEGLFDVTSRRLMFNQQGLPRRVAEEEGLPYAQTVNPVSPMWMGFMDQQLGSAGAPAVTTFEGNATAHFTNATSRNYFAKASIMHLSHVIQDLGQFYERPGETYVRRCAAMFRANPVPNTGYADQFTNGGGPAAIKNTFDGTSAAETEAEAQDTFDGARHLGHTTALQRVSRAFNHDPLHIRADGPGFDAMDVPDGTAQPKLQFSIFVPTAEFFQTMRESQASDDLVERFGVPEENVGLERFITATRRQNFLVPPRRHRAFPLLELA
ncbi:MAG TPA: hypothetical protein VMA83_11305 [Solirubrobacteraceae bacterium]|nr:hypothetical protein [Solirubrobacteraceae bacterium]